MIIRKRDEPAQKEASRIPSSTNLMPLLLALTLMQSGGELKGEDMSALTDWIASLGKPKVEEKEAEQKGAKVEGVEATMTEDGNLVIMMPASYFNKKQAQPDIVINIPAPIVNVSPQVNMPAPVVNIPQAKAPIINLTPKIEIKMPDPKKSEFSVQRDNYGNVLGITEKQ